MYFCLVSFSIKMPVRGKFYPRSRIAAASYWSQILLLAPCPLQPPPATGNPGTEEKCKQSAAQCKLKEGWSRDSFWMFSAHFRTLFCPITSFLYVTPCLIPVLLVSVSDSKHPPSHRNGHLKYFYLLQLRHTQRPVHTLETSSSSCN